MNGGKKVDRAPSSFLDLDGGRSVSCLHRPGKDEALLYLHGLGGGKQDFLGAWDVPEWTRYTLVAFDAPGCGATPEDPNTPAPSVDDLVDCAEALVARLGLSDLTIVGHSMGGLAGLLLAVRRPDLVRRFVSVEGNLVPEDCAIYSRGAKDVQGLEAQHAYLDALIHRMNASGVTGYDRAAAELKKNVRTEAFFSYCRSIVYYSDHEPLLDHLSRMDGPRLYVHGQASAGLFHLGRLSEAGVSVASVPDSDHFPMHSNPAGMYRALVRFVESTGAPSPHRTEA